MPEMHRTWRSPASADDSGQTLTEYALILALLVVVVFAAVAFFGGALHDMYDSIGSDVANVLP